MGNALKAQSKPDEAIAAYNKALSIKPDYAEAYYNIGVTLKEQGKLDEAIAVYNKALSISLVMLMRITTWALLSKSKASWTRR